MLKQLDITATWDGHALNLQIPSTVKVNYPTTPTPVTLSNTVMAIKIDGKVVSYAPRIVYEDAGTATATTFVPVFYLEKIFGELGLKTSWNGTDWVVTGAILHQTSSLPFLGKWTAMNWQNVYTWSGSKWVNLFSLASTTGWDSSVQGAVIHNGILYVVTPLSVFEYANQKWSRILHDSNPADAGNQFFVSPLFYNGHLYIATGSGVEELVGSTWRQVDQSLNDAGPLISYQGKLYVNSQNGVFVLNGTHWSPVGNVTQQAHADSNGDLAVINGSLYLAQGAVFKWTRSTWTEVGKFMNDKGNAYSNKPSVVESAPVNIVEIDGMVTVTTSNQGTWQWNGSAWVADDAVNKLNDANGTTPYLYTANGMTFAETKQTNYVLNGGTWTQFSPKLPNEYMKIIPTE